MTPTRESILAVTQQRGHIRIQMGDQETRRLCKLLVAEGKLTGPHRNGGALYYGRKVSNVTGTNDADRVQQPM